MVINQLEVFCTGFCTFLSILPATVGDPCAEATSLHLVICHDYCHIGDARRYSLILSVHSQKSNYLWCVIVALK